MSRPGRPLSLADEAYVVLRRRLTRCEIGPGTPFTARDVATDLGLGLTPVREALLQLDRERLVVTLPRRGYVAAPLTPSGVDDVLATWRVVTPQVAALAVRRAAPDAVDLLAARLEETCTAPLDPGPGSPCPAAEARSEASMLLAEQTGNDMLAHVVRFLDGQVLRVQLRAVRHLGPLTTTGRRRDRDTMARSGPSWTQILHTRDEAAAAARAATETDLFRRSVLPLVDRFASGPDPAPSAPARTTSADVAWERLRTDILGGDLPPGTRLTERTLAHRLGVGLTPVREALSHLDHERLVVTMPRRGYMVAPLSWRDVRHAAEVWRMVAPHMLELAVRNATPAQAAAVVAAMTGPYATAEQVVAGRSRGWRLAGRAAGNATLADVVALLDGLVARLFLVLRSRPDSPLPAATLDWEALFADRDPLAARQQLAEYVANLEALGTWAADRAARHDPRPGDRSQIYQRS